MEKRFDKEIKNKKLDREEEQLLKKIKKQNEYFPKNKKKELKALEEWEKEENGE